ncbi:hypothetical protein V3851_00965 [Paenibacillus sp. M1]|uniref:Uncharacterized protein n=1 Tax=Paenibacillus haidiansis TaxID=1574488 RepID=A0ABU7VKV3_9BACL
MNDRLSRTERYNGRRGRNNRKRRIAKRERRSGKAAEPYREAGGLDDIGERIEPELQFASVTEVHPFAEEARTEAKAELDVNKLPTRKEMFPSQRVKWTRWFFNSLLYVFVAIMILLLWWGISDSPWGQNHGL